MGKAYSTNGWGKMRLLYWWETKGKRRLGKQRHGCADIKMDLGEIEWGSLDWVGLNQDWNKWRSLVNAVMNFRVP
jgi:hypothetical protein